MDTQDNTHEFDGPSTFPSVAVQTEFEEPAMSTLPVNFLGVEEFDYNHIYIPQVSLLVPASVGIIYTLVIFAHICRFNLSNLLLKALPKHVNYSQIYSPSCLLVRFPSALYPAISVYVRPNCPHYPLVLGKLSA